VVAEGVTVKLAFAAVLVPTSVVKVASEYHLQLAPVPKVPPAWVNIILPPVQIVETDVETDVAATEG
jgi:hypothetical protein